MIVAVAHDADAKALLESVVQQPLERSPGGVHFHGALQPAVVRHRDVGVASADMRDHDGVLGGDRAEQIFGGVAIAVGRILAVDQNAGGAEDRPSFVAVEDVAVAAHAGVARPFVTRHADEAARHVEFGGEPVELVPERVGDLEVVALVADDIDEGLVARVGEIAARRIGADRLAALPVQVAPVAPQRRVRHDAHGIGARKLGAALVGERELHIARRAGDEIVEHQGTFARFCRNGFGEVLNRR